MQANARSTLVSLVEEHISTLVREAVVVKNHAKRSRWHSMMGNHNDNQQRGIIRRRLQAEDVNLALQWRGSEKIYATGTTTTTTTPHQQGGDDENVQQPAAAINLQEYLKSEFVSRPPAEVGLTLHWLAVDGMQPEIPENPMIHHSTTAANNNANTNIVTTDTDGVRVSQLLPLLLSEELQLYFTRVTSAIQRGGATPGTRKQQDTALASIAKDPGLQELVPFFTKYISQELYKHVGNPEHCRTLIRLASSMLSNPHLHLELHLHQLLPALMTCIVAERLASRKTDNHWALRREAAQTLIRACNLFGEDYPTLKARVLRALCRAASPDKSLSAQYGGIVAIACFGSKAVDAFLLPVITVYWKNWEEALKTSTNIESRIELQMCQQAVLHALGIFLREQNHDDQSHRIEYHELEDTFGDIISCVHGQETDYSLCIV